MTENPFYSFAIKLISIVALLTVILWLSANDFDETEIRVISWFGGFLTVGGSLPPIAKKLLGK